MNLKNLSQLSWIGGLYRLGQSGVLQKKSAEVQSQILQHVVTGFEADSGTIALIESSDYQSMTIVAGINLPQQAINSKVTLGEGVLGWVAEKGEALLLNGDVSNDTRFRNMAARTNSARPRSAMCWPLKLDNRIIGVLSINRLNNGKAYTKEDLDNGKIFVNIIALVIENAQLHIEQQQQFDSLAQAEEQLRISHNELQAVYKKHHDSQSQLLQSEKLASIGQLAAGVAHEINNPIGYVSSNLRSLQKYLQDIFLLIATYEKTETLSAIPKETIAEIQRIKESVDFCYLKDDIGELISESQEGISRVKKIVKSLKDFAHADTDDEWEWANLHDGLDSTLNIVWNEIKYTADVNKEYGTLPDIECLPSQLNQVFMNLLINAAHAIEGKGNITIRTGVQDNNVWIEVTDTGKGITQEHLNRIFDPFFTTKAVGKGTGLGLSVSHSIIQTHQGAINVASEVGRGTTFHISLPIEQKKGKNEI